MSSKILQKKNVRHANQTFHAIIFRSLILVKCDYEITVKEVLHINLRNLLLIDNSLPKAAQLF